MTTSSPTVDDPSADEPAAGPERPTRRRREEFFIHPDILLGSAAYRIVDRGTHARPPAGPGASPTGRR